MLRVLRPLVALLVLVAVVVAVVRTWHSVSGELSRTPAWAVLAALALMLAGLVPTVAAWRILMADLGSPLPWRLAGGVFFVGQLGKYLPGSLWVVLAQSDLAARHGVPRRRTAVVGLVQVGVSIVVGRRLAERRMLRQRFVAIRYSQVRSDERPSKVGSPCHADSRVSLTASSASCAEPRMR